MGFAALLLFVVGFAKVHVLDGQSLSGRVGSC